MSLDGTESEFEDEKIQVDLESHDHAFEEFELWSQKLVKKQPCHRKVSRQRKFKSIWKVEGRSNSSKTKTSSKTTMSFREGFISDMIVYTGEHFHSGNEEWMYSNILRDLLNDYLFQDKKIKVDPEIWRPVEQFKDHHEFRRRLHFR